MDTLEKYRVSGLAHDALLCPVIAIQTGLIIGHLMHYTEPSVTIHMFFTSCFLTSLRACLHEGGSPCKSFHLVPTHSFFTRCDYKVGR